MCRYTPVGKKDDNYGVEVLLVTSLTVTQGIAGSMPVHTAFVCKLMKRLEVYSNWLKRTVLKTVRSPKK